MAIIYKSGGQLLFIKKGIAMNSPLESLAAFIIAFILGVVTATGLSLYTRVLARKKERSQERSFQAI